MKKEVGRGSLEIMSYTVVLGLVVGLLVGCASRTPNQYGGFNKEEYKRIMERQRLNHISEDVKNQPEMTAEDYEILGDRYLRQDDMDRAFIQYNKAWELNPKRLGVRYKMGLLFLRKGWPSEALKDFEGILNTDENYALAYEGIGQAFLKMGKYEEAEKNFTKALRLNPDLWLSHNFLGMLYDRQARFGDAISQYQAAINLRPDEDFLFNNLGVSYYLRGDYEKSAEMLLRALETGSSNPKNPKIYNNLGLVLVRLERYEKALEAFKKGGDEAVAYNNLGYIYFLQGRYKEAIESFEKAIEISPSFYKKAGKNMKRAKIALHKRKPASWPEEKPRKLATPPLNTVKKESACPWAVYVESYKTEKKAHERRDILNNAGYKAFVEKREIPEKGTRYRILVGRFKDLKVANCVKEKLERDFPGAYIVPCPSN